MYLVNWHRNSGLKDTKDADEGTQCVSFVALRGQHVRQLGRADDDACQPRRVGDVRTLAGRANPILQGLCAEAI
jgi:hypothetical protein